MRNERSEKDPLPHIIIDGLEEYDRDKVKQFVRFIRDTQEILRFVIMSSDRMNDLTTYISDSVIFASHYIGNINEEELSI